MTLSTTNGRLSITECDSSVASSLVEEHHYSHKTTPNHFLSFLVNDRQGVLQLGYGIRPTKKNNISSLITQGNYCEFDRMWLSDDLPKFSESQVISLLLRHLRSHYPRIQFVITYADGSAGNVGTIYKATNAIRLSPIPCDFYILQSGERVHPVSMYHRHKSRAWGMLQNIYPGIKHIKGTKDKPVWQYRFLYILSRHMRKKYQAEIRGATSTEGLGQFQHSAPNFNYDALIDKELSGEKLSKEELRFLQSHVLA
jgi:hypothetical protein